MHYESKEDGHEKKGSERHQLERSSRAHAEHKLLFSIADMDKEFQFGLEVILEGFKGKLK